MDADTPLAQQAAQTPSTQKHRPTKVLPNNRITFDKQLTLLRGYAVASGPDRTPVGLATLGETVGMASTTVSLLNGFFSDVGFIEKVAGGYVPASEVLNFAQVYSWDPAKAGAELAPLLEKTWFAVALVPKLKITSMPEDQALAVLAKEAHANVDYRPKVRILLEYLLTAGIVAMDGSDVSVRRASPPAPMATQPSKPVVATSQEQDPLPVSTPVRTPSQTSEPLPLLIRGLLEQLPRDGSWTVLQARSWLQMAAMAFQVVYDLDSGEPLWPADRDPHGGTPSG